MNKKILALVTTGALLLGGAASFAGGRGGGHAPRTFCHNGHTITTDDDGLIRGHLKHVAEGKDSLGECQPEPTPTPTPTETTPAPEPTPSPTPTPTEPPVMIREITVVAIYTPGACDSATNTPTQPAVNHDETDGVLWTATGDITAKMYTASLSPLAGDYVTLVGTTTFGPFNMAEVKCTPSSEPFIETPAGPEPLVARVPLVRGESG